MNRTLKTLARYTDYGTVETGCELSQPYIHELPFQRPLTCSVQHA